MGFTVEEAQAELAKRQIAQQPTDDFTPEEAQAEMQKRAASQPTFMSSVRNILGIGPTTLQIPFVAAQNLQKLGLAVPGVKTGLATLANLIPGVKGIKAQDIQPTPVVTQPTTAAKIGGGLLSGILGEEIAAPVLAGAGIPALASALGSSAFGGMAASPDHKIAGAALGLLGRGGFEALKGTGNLVRNAPNLFLGKFAKNITRTAEREKQVGNQLYQNAFNGTENITPTVSQATSQSIRDLQELFPGKQSSVNKAIASFQRQPNLEGLHGLRSDFSKIARKIGDKAVKSGLDSNQIDQQSALENSVNNLVQDTRNNLKSISPQKVNQYDIAQQHWRDNVIPFRNLNSVRKLLGTEKEISTSLFKDMAKESVSAKRLRELTGVPKSIAQTGEFLHRKYLGIPVGLWLTGGIGSGLTFGKHFL